MLKSMHRGRQDKGQKDGQGHRNKYVTAEIEGGDDHRRKDRACHGGD
jgi:hypothetical protein